MTAREFQVPADYASIVVSADDVKSGVYKQHFGGGAEGWDRRGLLQLRFLCERGLLPGARLLDVGCGPLRAGVHLISYLDPGNYFGVDYNQDFIRAAKQIVSQEGLDHKRPSLDVIHDFSFCDGDADFALVFSVLNHCDAQQRELFFRNIPRAMRRGGRVYVTHVEPWLETCSIDERALRISDRFSLGIRTPAIELTVL
jgi:SAM-dependent methyltransferase